MFGKFFKARLTLLKTEEINLLQGTSIRDDIDEINYYKNKNLSIQISCNCGRMILRIFRDQHSIQLKFDSSIIFQKKFIEMTIYLHNYNS
jgi:hypothetical protein